MRRQERERDERGINESKQYLFWQPPSPPQSSEKFLLFPRHQLNHKEERKSHQHWQKEERRRKRMALLFFSRSLLMVTNLLICLYSGAAKTCSLLSPSHALPRLSLFLCSLPVPTVPDWALLLSNPCGEGILVSWCRSWELSLPLWKMALDGDKWADRAAL